MESITEWARPELLWFLVGLLCLLIEFMNPGLIIFFFGVGAWVVAALCFVADISLNIQLIVFLLCSILLIVSLRKWLKTIFIGRFLFRQSGDDMPPEFVGEHAVVTQAITPDVRGRVEFHGSGWDAASDETIPEGATVEIVDKNNITLIVKPVQRSLS